MQSKVPSIQSGESPSSPPADDVTHQAEAALAALIEEAIDVASDQCGETLRGLDKISIDYTLALGHCSPVRLGGLETWTTIKAAPAPIRIAMVQIASARLHKYWHPRHPFAIEDKVAQLAASQLLRSKLPFEHEDLAALAEAAIVPECRFDAFPQKPLLLCIERCLDGALPNSDLETALRRWSEAIIRKHGYSFAGESDQIYLDQYYQEMVERIERVLKGVAPPYKAAPQDPLDGKVRAWLRDMDAERAEIWKRLLLHAATAAGKSRPSEAWLAMAEPLVAAAGKDRVRGQLALWFDDIIVRKYEGQFLPEDTLKGLIWMAAHLDADQTAPLLGRFAGACFKKWEGGPCSTKLGNACILALGAYSGTFAGAAELARLRTAVRYPSVKERIEKAIEEADLPQRLSLEDLEEIGLPRFGLERAGRDRVAVGPFTATIAIRGDKVELAWEGEDGKARKTVPAAVKRDHAGPLGDLKRRVKEIRAARRDQARRLQDLYLTERRWPLKTWRERYLDHPLRADLVRNLIWLLEKDGEGLAFLPDGDGLTGLDGEKLSPGRANAHVRLWHPLLSEPRDVLAWRERLEALEIVQPFKQAHREVYVLTDAERRTRTYSNRYAAHVLRQFQFRKICHARGWTCPYFGHFDALESVHKSIPAFGLTAEYDVAGSLDEDDMNHTGVYFHVATDRVAFLGQGRRPVRLDRVPPVVFSEIMRDVDLFVSVTSVANDPDWTDGGPEGRYAAYWQRHAFSDLEGSAVTRRDVLERIVPRLAIADRLTVDGNFLEVRGSLRSYRIHIGSGNVMILPDKLYLCIVRAGKGRRVPKVYLPFAGDTILSSILSKAHLLAADDKITDESILRQMPQESSRSIRGALESLFTPPRGRWPRRSP